MDRERIGLQARICQLGQHNTARRLNGFAWLLKRLRRWLLVGWLWNLPQIRLTTGWIVLLCAGLLFYLLSLWLSAGERLIKNRWLAALRQRQSVTLADLLIAFSRRDLLLSARVAAFYRSRLCGRWFCILAVPVLLTGVSLQLVYEQGVSRLVFIGGATCLTLIWLAALFFCSAAREPLRTAASLITDQDSFAKRKSSLARLDKCCFQLMRFRLFWLFLPGGVSEQARAIYGSIRQ